MGIIRTNVAGVMFRNDDGSLRQGILAHMSKGPNWPQAPHLWLQKP